MQTRLLTLLVLGVERRELEAHCALNGRMVRTVLDGACRALGARDVTHAVALYMAACGFVGEK